MTARPCRLCGTPTPAAALAAAHVGPTRYRPKADVVVWLCPACASEATDAGRRRFPALRGGRR
jgi:hypothetical protein